ETVVKLISNTKTAAGLKVTCRLNRKEYEKGKKLTIDQINSIKIQRNDFYGEWNYTIFPKK
ncbi:MAG: ISAzo13 family transposase, partial [Deltaproteobacteria bacterium]|nr:ISAzo13 family transposase [Deltaproteobacteria bacterium]